MAGYIHRTRMALAAAAVLTAGCSHLSSVRWPWSHRPPAPPVPVNELSITSESGAAAEYPQYWRRNTLLVDLHAATQEGGVVLRPRAGAQWPVRLAFRVTPGSIGVLEVQGEQRVALSVAREGGPVDLELAPGVYIGTTVQIKVHWSAR